MQTVTGWAGGFTADVPNLQVILFGGLTPHCRGVGISLGCYFYLFLALLQTMACELHVVNFTMW
jgi:hypothetical protein